MYDQVAKVIKKIYHWCYWHEKSKKRLPPELRKEARQALRFCRTEWRRVWKEDTDKLPNGKVVVVNSKDFIPRTRKLDRLEERLLRIVPQSYARLFK